MTHLIIDGYNYLSRIRATAMHDGSNLDMLRTALLERLARYKKQRSTKITVIFDAYNSPLPSRQRESYRGIDIVYSRENETADDVILEVTRTKRSGLVVVTSDRRLLDEAKRCGVAFITPSRLEELIVGAITGKSDEPEDETPGPAVKKGNPRKLPKKLRRAVKTAGKA